MKNTNSTLDLSQLSREDRNVEHIKYETRSSLGLVGSIILIIPTVLFIVASFVATSTVVVAVTSILSVVLVSAVVLYVLSVKKLNVLDELEAAYLKEWFRELRTAS